MSVFPSGGKDPFVPSQAVGKELLLHILMLLMQNSQFLSSHVSAQGYQTGRKHTWKCDWLEIFFPNLSHLNWKNNLFNSVLIRIYKVHPPWKWLGQALKIFLTSFYFSVTLSPPAPQDRQSQWVKNDPLSCGLRHDLWTLLMISAMKLEVTDDWEPLQIAGKWVIYFSLF